MWRDASWREGYHIDNHKKFCCLLCGKEFIIGAALLGEHPPGFPICPYCGGRQTECTEETGDDQLEELAALIGCLGIYVGG